ncbi:MAG: conjugative transfer system coupling protein TraD [Thiohalocapsa sp.]|nr:conjugative transfer system coupling protein TraD [Thiohalocapsa sp.]
MDRYTNPWRANYEAAAVGIWLLLAAFAFASAPHWRLHTPAFHAFGLAGLLMALVWLPGALRMGMARRGLQGRALDFVTAEQLAGTMQRFAGQLWLGRGFEWERAQAQLAHDLLRVGPSRITDVSPTLIGARWLHGLAPREDDLAVPLATIEGHMLVVGTTGAGKTRLFDLLITQAVLRGEAVLIIDPKGDRELRDNARRACALAGRPDKFVAFHPAFAEDSCRIDPMATFGRHTELASRVAALVPSETGADPFKAFGQMAMSHIIAGLLLVEERPNLLKLRHYLEGGVDALVERALAVYCAKVEPRFDRDAVVGKARDGNGRVQALIRYYRQRIAPERPSSVVDGLVNMHEHERVHFSKMVASLMPVLVMLTSGQLGPLLSPDALDADDPRDLMRMTDLINDGYVAYIGLDSLSDGMVGSAIGSLLIAELTSIAGDRYNYGVNNKPVCVFIDEAAEVMNDPFVQLLNKGRGARLTVTVATQSFADFAARTGSQAKATQVLANLNNLIALRVLDAETQTYITDSLPKIRLKTLMRTQASSTQSDNPLLFSGNAGERLIEEEGDLLPPALLGHLPNLEYIGRLAGGRTIKGRLPILVGPDALPASAPTAGSRGRRVCTDSG